MICMKRLSLVLCLSVCASFAAAAPLTILTRHLGQYPYQLRLFAQPAFKSRLTALMGAANVRLLDLNTSTQGPLGGNTQVVYFSGNAPHMGGEEEGLLVYDVPHDALKVWIKTSGHVLSFQERGYALPASVPGDLRDELGNF